jgi:hypothetical protein
MSTERQGGDIAYHCEFIPSVLEYIKKKCAVKAAKAIRLSGHV